MMRTGKLSVASGFSRSRPVDRFPFPLFRPAYIPGCIHIPAVWTVGTGFFLPRMSEVRMIFLRMTTIVPDARCLRLIWTMTAGLSAALNNHPTPDLAW